MTWPELYQVLDREIARAEEAIAGRVQGVPEQPDAATLTGVEKIRQQQLAVEQACEVFARDRRWPILSKADAWDLLTRLEECRDFAQFIAQPERPHNADTRTFPDQILLRWVLVEYWRFAGAWRLLYRLDDRT